MSLADLRVLACTYRSYPGVQATHITAEIKDAYECEHFDSAYIAAEPPMPLAGTPERERFDKHHAQMVAGLLAGFYGHRGGRL